MAVRISTIVCAHNEASYISACLHSLQAQTRPANELIVVDNDSSDATSDVAHAVPGVRVVHEPVRSLVAARHTGLRAASGEVLAYIDADCRAPLQWLERIERQFRAGDVVAVTGPYRFYDWDSIGRGIVRVYDWCIAPPTHFVVHRALGAGAILYGGNFAVRRDALVRIGGFDRTIDFHGEDTNLGRRLTPVGRIVIRRDCWVWTSARRYRAMGKRQVFGLYVRNFWSEIVRHRPADRDHLDIRV
jgi:glycosyltransferase involved in cell wall biosynthesis